MNLAEIQRRVAATAKAHGFWDVFPVANPASVDRKLMLIVGEIAEAQEDWRKDGLAPYTEAVNGQTKPCGFEVELADAVIRILDLVEQLGISGEQFEQTILRKDAFNATRPFKHGKAF